MGVNLHTNHLSQELGSSSFLHSFFSTVAANLEPEGWGTRFPVLMNKLYQGRIPASESRQLMAELDIVESEFSKVSVSKAVWDIEDRTKSPPWGNEIAPHIKFLHQYFVTSNGRNIFEVLRECLDDLAGTGGEMYIE